MLESRGGGGGVESVATKLYFLFFPSVSVSFLGNVSQFL